MTTAARAITLSAAMVVVVAVGLFFAVDELMSGPPSVTFSPNASGQVDITMQTVGSIGFGAHPTWVSYLTQSPSGQWIHSTILDVPAHTRINMTIYQYDSGGALRNQQVGVVEGTIGGTATLNGKTFRVVNSNAGNGVGHTFSIPSIGLNVPLSANNPNANLCAAAPCTTKSPYQLVRFSFMSPSAGQYPFQCFIPCGLGWLYGNSGPMQSVGYMDGFLDVQ